MLEGDAMKVRLFPNQLWSAISESKEFADGSREIELPGACQVEEQGGLKKLTFSESPNKAFYGRLECPLQPLQLKLLRYFSNCGMATYAELRDAVWQKEVDDHAIRHACRQLANRLSGADFPVDMTTLRDRAVFELIG